jgi:hypothetical protein
MFNEAKRRPRVSGGHTNTLVAIRDKRAERRSQGSPLLQRILAASHSGRKTVLEDVPMQTIGTVSSRTFEVKGEAPVSVLYCPKKL